MLILALETSTELGSCALWRDGVVTERFCPEKQPHSETLLPLVRELLAESGVQIADLDAIAFGVGPGAFTGLRVACGAAQGLAVAADLPLIPVTSLETMAAQSSAERVLALLDARMGEVYSGFYERTGDGYVLRGDIRVSAPADVILPSEPGWVACGWGKAPPGVIWTRAVAMYWAGRRKFHSRPGTSTSAKISRKTRSLRRLLRRVAASPSRSASVRATRRMR